MPTFVLTFAAGGRIQALDAETARLSSSHIDILLYPFDLVISGRRAQVARSFSAERSDVKETAGRSFRIMAELQRIAEDLRSACLAYEEWEVLFREMLMVERDCLRRLVHRPPQPTAIPAYAERGSGRPGRA